MRGGGASWRITLFISRISLQSHELFSYYVISETECFCSNLAKSRIIQKPGCCDGALLAQRIILNVAQHCYESSKVRSSESSEILDHSGLIQIRAKPFCLIDDVGRKKAHESRCWFYQLGQRFERSKLLMLFDTVWLEQIDDSEWWISIHLFYHSKLSSKNVW